MMKLELEKKAWIGALAMQLAIVMPAFVLPAFAMPAFADQVTVEETQINTTQLKAGSQAQAPAPQIPAPVTVLDKDEVASLSQRLQAMKQQIEKGEENQWLTPIDALILRTKANTLVSQTDDLRTSYNKGRAEDIERQANELNIAISNAMKNAPAMAPTKQHNPAM